MTRLLPLDVNFFFFVQVSSNHYYLLELTFFYIPCTGCRIVYSLNIEPSPVYNTVVLCGYINIYVHNGIIIQYFGIKLTDDYQVRMNMQLLLCYNLVFLIFLLLYIFTKW